MGDMRARPRLIRQINQAFGSRNIAATANQLAPLSSRDDCLSIVDKLGFLAALHGGNLRRYRQEAGIPPLNLRILTLAFRAALQNQPKPLPLKIDIVPGQSEGVAVSVTPKSISVVLTRLDQQGARPAKK